MARSKHEFQTIRSEGGLLPADLLRRVVDPKSKLPGTGPEDYGLPPGERLNEAITQSWNRLRRHWAEFRAAARRLSDQEPGTGLTNDKWSLPLLRELGFGLLPTTPGPELDGRTYAVNRFLGPTAIHLVGCGVSLDRRAAGVRGAAASNPHGLVQEFLNRSPGHLWAVVSNGLRLRVLRDNQALSRQSFLEFDLEALFSGEVFPDFVLLWLMVHATRFTPRDAARPESCWLEQWTRLADEEGTRALGDLRAGVERALQILGEAFVSHPRNTALREALRKGTLPLADFHAQLLRLVYRLIFLFVAEDRTLDGESLLHPRDDSAFARLARERYAAHYSTARLRDLAGKIKGTRHGDLWQQFNLLVGALAGDLRFDAARRQLALPVLGSFLWSPASTAALNAACLQGESGVELANADFLEALRHLAFTRQGKILRPVDYKNLGAEELGGVYESLLALTPQISGDGARFTFAEFSGNARKTSGSYYTPDSLVQCLLDSALDPVVEEALKGKSGRDAEQSLLNLKVCDPAVGSGHFLVGAAHRLARHLARVRAHAQGESEPSPLLYQHALRDVIGRCLYGVDINPMAAELCRVSLWLEALEPGKPLSFLDHHIQVGNSLLGATPALLAAGIPDEAFTPIEGDDRARVTQLKRQNKREREEYRNRQGYLFEPPLRLGNLAAELARIDETADDTPEGIAERERRYAEFVRGSGYQYGRLLADTWCAAFVWKKDETDLGRLCPTERVYRNVERQAAAALVPQIRAEVERLRDQYQFFHWHLAFPDVFRIATGDADRGQSEWQVANGGEATPDDSPFAIPNSPFATPHSPSPTGWSGGFDVVLGNPPWERIKLQEEEWFAERRPEIANARNAAVRRRMIAALEASDPALYAAFLAARRQAEGASHLVRDSSGLADGTSDTRGMFALCGRGDVNTYSLFAEMNWSIISPLGRVGCIVPSGIATDDTTKLFFQSIIGSRSLVSLFSFDNKEGLFDAVKRSTRFCLLTLVGSGRPFLEPCEFVFYANRAEHLAEPWRRFSLTPEMIALLNPNTRTCPVFRSRRDAELTKAIYRRVPVLIREACDGQPEENPWGIKFSRMFDMSNDSHLFRTREQLESEGWTLDGNVFRKHVGMANGETRRGGQLPLYEAKMIDVFDHRAATYEGDRLRDTTPSERADPYWVPQPRYWVAETNVAEQLEGRWGREWLLGWQDVTDVNTMARTVGFGVTPRAGVGHTFPLIVAEADPSLFAALEALFSSFVLDYVGRQKIGGVHLTYQYLKQFPVLPQQTYSEPCPWADADHHSPFATHHSLSAWLLPRVLELTYTAWDLEPFARDCGYTGPPFRWDEERRFLLRAELDAAFFHLYLPAEANGEWRIANGEVDEHGNPLAIRRSLLAAFPTPRDAVDYILDTFPIVRRKDEEKYNGDYRTKRVILEIYNAMQEAILTGKPYRTRLDPPPGPPAGWRTSDAEERMANSEKRRAGGEASDHSTVAIHHLPSASRWIAPAWPPGAPRPADWPPHIHPPRDTSP